MKDNLILIGFMGAGKTSVGELLARELGVPFIDTDARLEKENGKTVQEIFAVSGEACFRNLETELLRTMLGEKGKVISVGGGLPMREENRRLLKKLGTVIFLRVWPETVLERLKGDLSRPMLAGDDPERRVRSLLGQRGPVYESAADWTIDTDGRTPCELARELAVRRRQSCCESEKGTRI